MILTWLIGGATTTLALGSALLPAPAPAAMPSSADGDPIAVVATTSILGSITAALACDGAIDVETIIANGGDPHRYEPSFQDREAVDAADVIVVNGLGLEGQLLDTIDASDPDGTRTFVVTDHVTARPAGPGAHDHGDGEHGDDEHDHAAPDDGEHDETLDPHVWFDPTLVAQMLPALADALIAAGADPDAITGCLDTATADLADLDAELTATLSDIPEDDRLLVTNHDALGYFADRYGFTVIGTVMPSTSTLAEATPAELDALAELITERDVPAIFTEQLDVVDDATTLGERLGVEVVALATDSLEGDHDTAAGLTPYADMLRDDAHAIADALSPR